MGLFLYSNQNYSVSQDSTVAEVCSAFHSFSVLWLPPLVSTTLLSVRECNAGSRYSRQVTVQKNPRYVVGELA
jgi:hypothetical protein